ncbi:ribose transport system substrate-binding protein [Lentzea xinjiangensis]|uniref:Ribose transport system substrate-binding protein n=1 Tax=Lentzea xinjiangensis TaxID=402600 RepID=A0A1H9M3I2_9PSEU|nr:sugar ABC transporter substrate-binding protein [Lentzea xinjiangensis]SER18025.1 ribose transport system substrate-binding protein [Lentzea xinjiangensis]
MVRVARLVLPAVLVAATGVGGCGTEQTSDDPPTIGFVAQNNSRDFSKEMSEGFRAGAAIAGGVRAEVTGPDTHDGPKQIELLEDLATRAKGGIGFSAVAPELVAEPMAAVTGRGIPLIAVAGGQVAPGSGVKLMIENDGHELGSMLADATADRLPPDSKGKIVIGSNSPGMPALDQRVLGMRARLTERLPGVQVIGPLDTGRDQTANLATWHRLADANPDALALLGAGDVDAINLAAVHAAKNAKWLAAAFSVDPIALRGVKDGHLFATVSAEHFLKGAVAGWMLAQHAKSGRKLPEGWFAAPGLLVQPSNVDEIIHRQSGEATRLAAARPLLDALTANSLKHLRPLDQAR